MPKKKDKKPVRIPLEESPVGGVAVCSSVCDSSQKDSEIQDGEKSVECIDAADISEIQDGEKSVESIDSTDISGIQDGEQSVECIDSTDISGIQDGEQSVECIDATDISVIMLDTTADTGTDEGNESLVAVEAIMPEGVELDTEGDETIVEDEKTAGPVACLDVVPSYDSNLTGVLTDVEFSMLTGKKINEARPKQTCFNCLGDHNMAQCTEPLDYSKISVNRKKHMGNRMSHVRYHEDCVNKYGQFQPGKMSENLRHALGLRSSELPLYIYRMRVLGYPPGWLMEAEVHQADVKMYDATGKSVSHPAEEEGEAEPSTVKYKPEKLVSFPGFNDRVPRGVYDEHQKFDFPPMQPCHHRKEFLRFMNQNKAEAYKKKKLKASELRSKTPPLSIAMEVEECEGKAGDIEFNPPLPAEDPPPPPTPQEPPPNKRVKELEDGEITDDSQESMDSLTVKKQKIMKELGVESTQKDTKPDANSSDGNRESQEESEDSQPSVISSTQAAQSENSCSGDGISEHKIETKKHHRSHSKGFNLGTVIPESFTPFTSLPASEKWTVDVSEHIVFDNLPDALGTWDKMKGLMTAVRKKVSIIHADEDD